MCPVHVELQRGDILAIEADVCVSSIHRSKDMTKGPLPKHILGRGGQSIQDNLYKKEPDKELKIGQVVTDVPPGKLKNCKELMFICLRSFEPRNEELLLQSILEILELAEVKKYTSVSFPALGVGQGYPPEKVATCLINAVALHNFQYPESLLETVHIVLLNKDIDVIKTFLVICAKGKSDLQGSTTEDTADLMSELSLGGTHNFDDPTQAKPKPTTTKKSATPTISPPRRTRQQPNTNHLSKFPRIIQSVMSLINKQGITYHMQSIAVNIRPTVSKNMVGFQLNVGIDIGFLQSFIPDSLKSFWAQINPH